MIFPVRFMSAKEFVHEDRPTRMNDLELLREYAQANSQQAFADIVRRHADWVYAVAARRVRDPQLAEDVAQAAFIVLSRKASTLLSGRRPSMHLAGWLYQVVQLASKRALRDRARRQQVEQLAAATRSEVRSEVDDSSNLEELMPQIDAMLARLGSADREAVLRRFYQRQSFAEVGQAIGLSEDAARKRVSRAIQRIRTMLRRDGISEAALSAGLWTSAASFSKIQFAVTGSSDALAKGVISALAWKSATVTIAATAASFILAVAGVATVMQLTTPSNAAMQSTTQPAPVIDPVARQRITDLYTTYRALKSASWEMDYRQPDNPDHFWGPSRKATVAFRRPNFAVVHSSDKRGEFWAMSDGKDIAWMKARWADGFEVPDPSIRTYYTLPAPPGDDAIKRTFEGGDADGFDLFRWMLAGIDPIEFQTGASRGSIASMVQGPAAEIDGVTTDSVIATFQEQKRQVVITYEIGRDDHFLRRITQNWKLPDGKSGMRTATYSRVRINPQLPDEMFAIAPPGLLPEPTQYGHSPRLMVGADPLPLETVDIDGRGVTLADYRGKVVLVLFASPVASIAKPSSFAPLYQKYHVQGFEILQIVANGSREAGYREEEVARLAREALVPWRVAYDAGRRLFTEFNPSMGGEWNLAIVIGRDGKIALLNPTQFVPLEGSFTEMQIRKVLEQPAPAR